MNAKIVFFVLLLVCCVSPIAAQESEPVITVDNAARLTRVASVGADIGRIAASGSTLLVAGSQGVWLYNALDEDVPARLLTGHTGPVNAVKLSPDGEMIASAGSDGTIRLWSMPDAEEIAVLEGHEDSIRDIAFSENGRFLVSVSVDETNNLRLWDVLSQEQVAAYDDIEAGYTRVEFLGGLVFAATMDSSYAVFNMGEERFLAEIDEGVNSNITSLAAHPTLPVMAVGLFSGRVLLANLETLEVTELELHEQGVRDLTFNEDGRVLASVGMDDRIVFYDMVNNRQAAEGESSEFMFSVDFSGYTNVMAMTGDGRILIFNSRNGELINERALALPTIRQMAYHPQGEYFVAATYEDAALHAWDAESLSMIATLSGHEEATFAVAFSPSGDLIASTGGDGTVRLWDAETFEQIVQLGEIAPELSTNPMSAAFSPDGATLAVGHYDGRIVLWDVEEAEILETIQTPEDDPVWRIAYTPDGAQLVTSNGVFDAESGEFVSNQSIGDSGAVNPDGSNIVTTAYQQPLQVYPLEAEGTAKAGYASLSSDDVAYSPDGSLIAFAANEHVRVIDVAQGRQIALLPIPQEILSDVLFSPDGRSLLVGTDDGVIFKYAVGDEAVETAESPTAEGFTLEIDVETVIRPEISENAITAENFAEMERTALRESFGDVYEVAVPNTADLAVLGTERGVALFRPDGSPPELLAAPDSVGYTSVTDVDISEDGSLIAATYGLFMEGAIGGSLVVWQDLEPIFEMNFEAAPYAVALDNTGDRVAVGFNDGVVDIYQLEDGDMVTMGEKHGGSLLVLQFSPDNEVLSTADSVGNQGFFNSVTGELLGALRGSSFPLTFKSDLTGFYYIKTDGMEVRSMRGEVQSEQSYPDDLNGNILDVDNINGRVAVGGQGMIWILDIATGEVEHRFEVEGTTGSGAFAQDGMLFFSTATDGFLRVWGIDTGERIDELRTSYTDTISTLAISPDSEWVAAGAADRSDLSNIRTVVNIWDWATGDLVQDFVFGNVADLEFVPGTSMLGVLEAGTLTIYDLPSAEVVHEQEDLLPNQIAFSPDGTLLANFSGAHLRLIDISTGDVVLDDPGAHLERLNTLVFSPDGSRFVTGSHDAAAKLWDAETGEQIALMRHYGNVYGAAFSPDGEMLAVSTDTDIALYDVSGSTPEYIRTVVLGAFRLNDMAFSADGELLLVSGTGGLYVYAVEARELLDILPIANGTLLLSPDGAVIAAGADSSGVVEMYTVGE